MCHMQSIKFTILVLSHTHTARFKHKFSSILYTFFERDEANIELIHKSIGNEIIIFNIYSAVIVAAEKHLQTKYCHMNWKATRNLPLKWKISIPHVTLNHTQTHIQVLCHLICNCSSDQRAACNSTISNKIGRQMYCISGLPKYIMLISCAIEYFKLNYVYNLRNVFIL